MFGEAKELIRFLEGHDKRFIIPVYQRNYSWREENCRQLYDDLIKLIRNNREMHFFGSIVSVFSGRSQEYLIIDGQQRVTTVSLLLLAIYNILHAKKLQAKDQWLEQKVLEEYLVDKYEPLEKRIKLKTVSKDLEAFERLFDGEPSEFLPNSAITINYRYFYDRILKEEVTIDELFDAISKLMVINITVSENDNPQLIFESLNSTGVDLTEGDKIRNYVLMGQKPAEQERLYKLYWSSIETSTGSDNNNNNGVSLFIRDYLSMMQLTTPSMDKIYPTFKAYVETRNITMEDLLKELKEYASFYHQLIAPRREFETLAEKKGLDPIVSASIYRLNYIETTVCRPFFLQVLHLHKENVLNQGDLRDIFLIVENYLFRRNICEVPTNALNKIFLTLDRDVFRFDDTYDNYVEKMKYVLTTKQESGRFPDDDEFKQALSEKLVYKMRGHFKNYLFERFENYGTAEVKDVISLIENGTYTIEHIMPQTLTAEWRKELGESECDEIHSVWLHRLANLTLTAYNSSYSNHSFTEKRTGENGFLQSGIRMNQRIAQKERWTLAELEERNEHMVSRALEIWSYPFTAFKPAEKQLNSVTLDDDVSLTGSQISKFSFKGVEQPAESWSDMYTSVLRALHSENSAILTNLAYTTDPLVELASHVYSEPVKNKTTVQIAPNIYLWTGTSTQHKMNTLRKLFALFGVDPSELVFYLKDQNDEGNGDDNPERFEVRKKYWSLALPYIHESLGMFGPCSNVNPSTSNWISGFFGVGGFNITCVANYDCAKVQLYLGKSNPAKNKEAYDFLYKHKQEIETKIGVELDWQRADTYKSSSIFITLNGVSIANETDWIRMAKFHAEWSKKFCEVILPVLKELYPSITVTKIDHLFM